jgi:hypothetical protein
MQRGGRHRKQRASHLPQVSGWAIFLGVGAALATGQGVAHADSTESGSDAGANQSQPSKPHPLSQLKKDISSLTARSGAASSSAASTGSPRSVVSSAAAAITKQLDSVTSSASGAKRPLSVFTGGSSASSTAPLAKVFATAPTALKDVATTSSTVDVNPAPSVAATAPDPADAVQTPYGAIGKWLIQPGGGVSEWGGQPYMGKTLVEPINVIIVDPTSTSPEESTNKLNRDMTLAGFPAQPIHSTGFMGMINGDAYGQQPTGDEQAFSDNLFFLPNDHARAFGPAPLPNTNGQQGYVWTVAASTETPGIYNGALTHSYVSYNLARDILVLRLLLTGQATFVGYVPMNNEYNTDTETTGDHDGYAIVLKLR